MGVPAPSHKVALGNSSSGFWLPGLFPWATPPAETGKIDYIEVIQRPADENEMNKLASKCGSW